jgi:hypothetical protein
MASSSIADVSSIQLVGGNNLTRTFGTINNLSGLQSINGFTVSVGSASTIGVDKVFLGQGAGAINTGRYSQICIGYNAGFSNTKDDLIAIGQDAGASISAGIYSVCIGFRAGAAATNDGAVQIGNSAGQNQNGLYPVMLGLAAGSNSRGNNVVAIGFQATLSSRGSNIVAIGENAAQNNSGSHVVAAGYQAALNNSGSAVVALGFNAGYGNTGSNCVFLGSNGSPSITNVSAHTFLVYSAQTNNNPPPFLRGDMSGNTLGIGKAPVAGFGLAVEGSIQNTINISTVTSSPLILTPANAATRFFVSAAVTLSFVSLAPRDIGTHWIVTNTSTNTVAAGLSGGTVFGSGAAVTLPATSGGLGRGITFAYSGIGSNYFAF